MALKILTLLCLKLFCNMYVVIISARAWTFSRQEFSWACSSSAGSAVLSHQDVSKGSLGASFPTGVRAQTVCAANSCVAWSSSQSNCHMASPKI